jgi:hypothetical protein
LVSSSRVRYRGSSFEEDLHSRFTDRPFYDWSFEKTLLMGIENLQSMLIDAHCFEIVNVPHINYVRPIALSLGHYPSSSMSKANVAGIR